MGGRNKSGHDGVGGAPTPPSSCRVTGPSAGSGHGLRCVRTRHPCPPYCHPGLDPGPREAGRGRCLWHWAPDQVRGDNRGRRCSRSWARSSHRQSQPHSSGTSPAMTGWGRDADAREVPKQDASARPTPNMAKISLLNEASGILPCVAWGGPGDSIPVALSTAAVRPGRAPTPPRSAGTKRARCRVRCRAARRPLARARSAPAPSRSSSPRARRGSRCRTESCRA